MISKLSAIATGSFLGILFAFWIPLSFLRVLNTSSLWVSVPVMVGALWLACFFSGFLSLWTSLFILGDRDQILSSLRVIFGFTPFNHSPFTASQLKAVRLANLASVGSCLVVTLSSVIY